MLIDHYELRLVRPPCNFDTDLVGAFGLVSADLSPVIPYLNAVFRGGAYSSLMPCINFIHEGRGCTVQPSQIGVGGCRDEAHARESLDWLVGLINDTWERRDEITPCHDEVGPLTVLEVYRRLPGTNCGQCGEPTCMAFAAKLIGAQKGIPDCGPLLEEPAHREKAAALSADLSARGYAVPEGWL